MPLPNILEFIGTNITQRKFQEAQEKLLNYLGVEVPTKADLSNVSADLNAKITPKADKTYLDASLTAIAGGHKAYATLAGALSNKSTFPRDSIIEITNDGANNGAYQWNGGDLTKSDYDPLTQAKSYTDIKVYDVYVDKLSRSDIFTESSNLFDNTAVTRGYSISSTGEVSANANYAFSDFIAANPSEFYYFDGFRHIAFYDINKNFISRFDQVVSGAGTVANPYKYYGAIQTPPNCYYIRANYNQVSLTDSQVGLKINKGSVSLPYEPFYLSLKDYVRIEKGILQNRSVTVDNLDFIEKSSNLFNYAACTDEVIIRDTGLIEPFANYAISDFIAVKSGTKYTISSSDAGINVFIHIAYYNATKEFLRREVTTTGTVTITTGNDVAFVRFNINKNTGLPSQKERMFNEGMTALPYEPWQPPKLLGVTVESEVDRGEVEQIIDDRLAELPSFEQYVTQSYNLFDASTTTIGKVISDTGVITDRADYAISDFISVDAGEKYTITSDVGYIAWIYTAYYDTNKNFIERVNTANDLTGFKTIEIPAGVSYVRFDINLNSGLPSQRNRMFVEGDKVLPYKPYRIESLLPLAPEALKEVGGELRLNRTDNFIFDYAVDAIFTTSATLGSYLDFNSSTSAQVYQMYDDLMTAHPNHITKQVLGNDAWGNPIALYKFKAPQPSTSQPTKIPKIFITTGVHGMEHVSVLTAYLMFEQIMTNWRSNKMLEVLRNNVEFLIIPVVNPTGYNKFTRKNDNGVDLNRNWPVGFGWQSADPSSSYYGGAAPLDQLESQHIVKVFDENPDISAMYDFHTFNGISAETNQNLIWVAAYDGLPYVEHMAQKLARTMTNHWREKFAWIPASETWFAGYSDTTIKGATVSYYAAFERGIPFTSIFEVGGRWWIDPTGVPYDLNHKQSCLEALVNFITINLNELKRI